MTDDRPATPRGALRPDLQLIADMIAPDNRVLDVGCGDGALLHYLTHQKQVDGRGIELGQDGVNACVSQGLSVIQGDADTDLADYPSDAFDYVVLSQTLQATHNPKQVLDELVRIGRRAVVSFINLGYWRFRLGLLVGGRVPVTAGNGYRWYDSPDIHLFTIRDFVDLCRDLDLVIEKGLSLNHRDRPRAFAEIGPLANLRDEQGIFLLRRNRQG